MAKILTTKGSAAALEDLIRRSEKEIYLISFSFIISEAFLRRIKNACQRGAIVNIVYGKTINPDGIVHLKSLENLNIYFLKNMHAKIFANETKCIIGSMNFSEFSEENNTELGVLLSLDNDKVAYLDAINHCKDIIKEAQLKHSSVSKQSFQAPTVVNRNAGAELMIKEKNQKIVDIKLFINSRHKVAFNVLEKNYGPVSIKEISNDSVYFELKAYNMIIFVNDLRVDFIYNDNKLYYSKRPQIKSLLSRKIQDDYWVNSSRINIVVKTESDIGNVIREVMSYTFVNLI